MSTNFQQLVWNRYWQCQLTNCYTNSWSLRRNLFYLLRKQCNIFLIWWLFTLKIQTLILYWFKRSMYFTNRKLKSFLVDMKLMIVWSVKKRIKKHLSLLNNYQKFIKMPHNKPKFWLSILSTIIKIKRILFTTLSTSNNKS